MKNFLLQFKWFRNLLADVWEEGWEAGESWDQGAGGIMGIDIDFPPRNPYVK